MAEKKFSASIQNMMDSGKQPRKTGGQNKPQKVMTFNHEQEDKIRDKSRKVVYLVQELKEDNLTPKIFGLLLKKDAVSKSLGIEKPSLDDAYLEYDKKTYVTIKSKLIQHLSDGNIPIVNEIEIATTNGGAVVRLLINIRGLQ